VYLPLNELLSLAAIYSRAWKRLKPGIGYETFAGLICYAKAGDV